MDSSLCILNLDYHLLLSENCTGQVFRAGRLPEVRSRIGRYQISSLESTIQSARLNCYKKEKDHLVTKVQLLKVNGDIKSLLLKEQYSLDIWGIMDVMKIRRKHKDQIISKVQQILNILEIMDQVNVNYIIDVHFFL